MFFFISVFIGIIYSHACVGAPVQDGCHHPCTSEDICKAIHSSGKCFYVFPTEKKTWDESGQLCKMYDMNMVQSNAYTTEKGVKFQLRDIFENSEAGSNVWLGGKVNDFNRWIFVNEVGLNETQANEPAAFKGGEQLHICGIFKNPNIDKDDCRYTKPFICRFDDAEKTQGVFISDTVATWYDARSHCVRRGGDLFYLKSGENMDYWKTKLPANHEFFIGLTRRLWEWENGTEILHFNWQDREPNKLSEKCLVMYPSTGQWNDMPCESKMIPLCYGGLAAEFLPDSSTLGFTLGVGSQSENSGSCSGCIAGIAVLTIIAIIALLAVAVLVFRRSEPSTEESCLTRIRGYFVKETAVGSAVENEESEDEQRFEDAPSTPIKPPEAAKLLQKSNAPSATIANESDVNESTFLSVNSTAVQEEVVESEWPFAVELDDTGKECKIILALPGMQVLANKMLPKNASLLNEKIFEPRAVELCVALRDCPYKYKKTLPMAINPELSQVKYRMESIILQLKKIDESHSWSQYKELLAPKTVEKECQPTREAGSGNIKSEGENSEKELSNDEQEETGILTFVQKPFKAGITAFQKKFNS